MLACALPLYERLFTRKRGLELKQGEKYHAAELPTPQRSVCVLGSNVAENAKRSLGGEVGFVGSDGDGGRAVACHSHASGCRTACIPAKRARDAYDACDARRRESTVALRGQLVPPRAQPLHHRVTEQRDPSRPQA